MKYREVRDSAHVLESIRSRTRTYILFCNKTRVPMFYFLYIKYGKISITERAQAFSCTRKLQA